MRTRILMLILGLGLFSGSFDTDCKAQPSVTLAWTAYTNGNAGGYYLSWGTNSQNYFATNSYPITQTWGTVSNLIYGVPYYIAIASFGSNLQMSPFSSEIVFITNAPSATIGSSAPGGAPPLPPGPGGTGRSGTKGTSGGGQSWSGGGSSGSSSSSSAAASSAASTTNITQALIWGIPPLLNMAVSNSQITLSIGGTVGATYAVQTTSTPQVASSWTTITNVTITNAAPMQSNAVSGAAQDAIDLAFVPGYQTVSFPVSADQGFTQVVMSNDYPVLASIVLQPQGYSTRLVLVNMPGLTDDGCYISQASSFIHCQKTNPTTYVMQLEGSGSTIRQIATTLASHLNLDWTTASEFVYSNGVGQILATVVEADPASSDPVAGTTPTSSVNINF